MKLYSLLLLLAVCCLPKLLYGDIVSHSVSGLAIAELENATTLTDTLSGDVDASTLILAGPSKSGTVNSITTTILDYNWNGTTLTGFGFIDEEKTIAAKPGGLHQGESTLTFQFTIDKTSTYSLTGNYGYVGATGSDDTVSWSLTGTSYSASGIANAVSGTTVHGQLFSNADTITAGTYTLVLTADFHETVNDIASREAGWEIESFTISETTAIPEPSSFIILAGFALANLRRRRSQS